MTREEEKYTTLDTEQCKWWVNHLFNMAKEKACNSHNFDDAQEIQSAQDKIIKSIEQKSCEDAVSRQALIERINNAEENFKADHMESIASDDGDAFVDGVLSGVFNIREMVAQAPSVTPTACIAKVTFDKDELQKIVDEKVKEMVVERKKGKWIEEPNCWLRCSCCKSHYPHTSINGVKGSNYCPNCGAEMESEE